MRDLAIHVLAIFGAFNVVLYALVWLSETMRRHDFAFRYRCHDCRKTVWFWKKRDRTIEELDRWGEWEDDLDVYLCPGCDDQREAKETAIALANQIFDPEDA